MSFNADLPRAVAGTEWVVVWDSLVKLIASGNIVDESCVIPVLDDEQLPAELPPQRSYITVRLPSLIWSDGDVASKASGTGTISQLFVTGQSRISLWLWNERDTPGKAPQAIDQAIAGAGRGARMLSRMVALVWENDLFNVGATQTILARTMKLISVEPPGPGRLDMPRAWRVTVEMQFHWLLSLEV